MLIEYHHKYLRRLAEVYLDKYGMYGYKTASVWFKTFLDVELRARVKPWITTVAQERNLKVD